MSSPPQDRGLDDVLVIDACGPAEWVVGSRHGGPALHVYRLGPADWLVSEVGRATEGRGPDLEGALTALDVAAWPARCSDAILRAAGIEPR